MPSWCLFYYGFDNLYRTKIHFHYAYESSFHFKTLETLFKILETNFCFENRSPNTLLTLFTLNLFPTVHLTSGGHAPRPLFENVIIPNYYSFPCLWESFSVCSLTALYVIKEISFSDPHKSPLIRKSVFWPNLLSISLKKNLTKGSDAYSGHTTFFYILF